MSHHTKDGFHKLKNTSDSVAVLGNGLKASSPARVHWLGAGIYFFLDPNGFLWAQKWPMNSLKPRTGSKEGILKADLDLESALDLTNNDVRRAIEGIIGLLKLKLRMTEKLELPITDGLIFAALFRYQLLEDVVDCTPTAIIANFDDTYKSNRIPDSKVFMDEGTEIEIMERSAQLQACIIDSKAITNLTIV